jgi:hypothetical protein
MKYSILLMCILFAGITATAQGKKASAPATYDVAVSFNSICCGPPSPDFLKAFVKKFNKDNKVKLTTFIAGGCGREGEFSILFSLAGVKARTKAKFMGAIKNQVTSEEAKNKTANSSSGNMILAYNTSSTDYSSCRSGISTWE